MPAQSDQTFAVYALQVHAGLLFAGGSFPVPFPAVMRWDGTGWNPVGSAKGLALSLASCDSSLLAGGFLRLGGSFQERILRWEGIDWTTLGSGVDDIPRAILCDGEQVYLGGNFSRAGNVPSRRFAHWDGSTPPPAFASITLGSGRPNPFSADIRLDYALSAPQSTRLSVHDLAGREIRLLHAGLEAAGPHVVTWDGRDNQGIRQAAGVYFIRQVRDSGSVESRKAVLLP